MRESGEVLDIKTYVMKNDQLLAILIDNRTSDVDFTAHIKFRLQNCHIDGTYADEI